MNIDKIKQILFVIWPLSVGRNNPAFIGLLLIQTLRVCRVSVSEVKYNLIGFIKHFSRFLLCKQMTILRNIGCFWFLQNEVRNHKFIKELRLIG